jgi:hypothetical protein
LTDYLKADCIVCDNITDVVDGSDEPVLCVTCYDKGLSARDVVIARRREARAKKARGQNEAVIMSQMHISRSTLWRWLHEEDKMSNALPARTSGGEID